MKRGGYRCPPCSSRFSAIRRYLSCPDLASIFFWLQAAVPPAIASSQPVWNLNNSGAIRFLSTVSASQKGYLNWMKNNDTYFSFRQMLQFCLNAIVSDWKRTLARLCASRVLPGFAYAWPSLAGLPRGSEQAVLWTAPSQEVGIPRVTSSRLLSFSGLACTAPESLPSSVILYCG